jgi:hypothetical protein
MLRLIDWLWHHGPYQLTVRRFDRLHVFMHRQVCSRVEGVR